jgi:glycosyltransferase involved in cell wall biosynthesis
MAIVPPNSAVATMLGATIRQFPIKMRGHWDVLARHQISACIAAQAPDIVMSYLGRATRLTSLSRRHKPVHVARLGGYYNLQQYRHAHAWVGNTRGICDYMIQGGFAAERVRHIPNFVEPATPASEQAIDAVRAELGLERGQRVVIALGRLHRVKGFDVLLRALAQLPVALLASTSLVILGEGAERGALAALAGELGIAARVRMPGWRADLAPYLAVADLFVCPSRHEPFGNVLLDAWSHRVPLLSTRTAGAMELVTENVDGVLIGVEEVDEMAARIEEMLQATPERRQRLIDAGMATLTARYSKAVVVSAYDAFYAELMRRS